jgi:hypothetical protein
LAWHHLDPAPKGFELDLRTLSNRSDAALASEAAKCRLLWANCHADTRHPDYRLK